MKIGFYSKHPVGGCCINGDEILSKELIKGMKEKDPEVEGYIYAPNKRPEQKNLDFMIWLGDFIDDFSFSKKNILYVQSGLPEINLNYISSEYPFDGFISYSQDLLKKYENVWKSTLYLPLCVDTNIYHPVEEDEKFSFDVSYVGGSWKERCLYKKYIMPVIKFKFGLFGSWKEENRVAADKAKVVEKIKELYDHRKYKKALKECLNLFPDLMMNKLTRMCRGKISDEDIPVLYSSSKINLNFSTELMLKDNTITGRTFEILACKGFCISDRTPFAEETLKDCVVFTDGGKDLKNKIKYYLKHPEERKRIAQNGYNWVISNVTYKKMAAQLLDYLNKMEK